MNTTRFRSLALRRRQLDREIVGLATRPSVVPAGGWIAAVRQALGMTGAQLARRMAITQPSLLELERAESAGRITLNRLGRAAQAMDCHVVYAVVPNNTNFEGLMNKRAESVASIVVGMVADSMALESQDIDAMEQDARIAELKVDLLRSPRTLWTEP
jgi:predicted DNA-binding mobile mystery protein A